MNNIWLGSLSELSAIRITGLLLSIGVMLDCAEMWTVRRVYAPDGMFSWEGHRLDCADRHHFVAGLLDSMFRRYPFSYLILIEFASAVAVVVFRGRYSAYLIAVIIFVRFLSIVRNGHDGSEGADHMLLLLLSCLVLYPIAPGATARRVVFWFICAETLLAYATAGVVKLRNRRWREGTALQYILATTLFGHNFVRQAVSQLPGTGRAICWGVILFECTSPFVVLTGYKGCLLFVFVGLCFHFAIAIVQGLNLFVWVFLATYPALLITARDVSHWLRS
jgi:hypothetical protein